MSLEIKNLSINVRIEADNKSSESSASLKECRQMIENSIRWDKER